jgi:hypothetical protein
MFFTELKSKKCNSKSKNGTQYLQLQLQAGKHSKAA